MIEAIVLNGPHKDEMIKVCPHCLYHDMQTKDGELAEYKLKRIHGMYYLVYQRIR